MKENFLFKIFEHNNWANNVTIQASTRLSDEQLDARPQSATMGSIRETLIHLVAAQQGYLSLLTLPVEERNDFDPIFEDLLTSAQKSGEAILALVKDDESKLPQTKLRTKRGYLVEPWVVFTQIINHATEHREQINSMLSAMQLHHPDLDGWIYGEAVHPLVPIPA